MPSAPLSPLHRLANWILVVIVFSMLLYCWGVFVFVLCPPLLDYHWAWVSSYLIVFHVLLLLVVTSYLRAIFTTSFIPSTFSHNIEEDLDSTSLVATEFGEVEVKKILRRCDKCSTDKPDRAHHCSACSRCVLKMDHHCPWINNCVGWNNYKYFMLFTTYTFLLCIAGVVMTIPALICTVDWNSLGYTDILVLIGVFIGGIFAITLLGFLVMHYRLVFNNLTTIESMEKNLSWGLSPWDRGVIVNWTEVFGKHPLLWFLPVNTLVHDGCTYPHRSELVV